LVVVTSPAVEPITLEQFKTYARVDSDLAAQDLLIANDIIPSARERCEEYANRAFVEQELLLTLDGFRDPWNGSRSSIRLPRPPLVGVTSIKYLDPEGLEQTLDESAYRVDKDREPGRVLLGHGRAWPAVLEQESVVFISFKAGYSQTEAGLPGYVRDAVYLAAATRFEHREEILTGTTVTELSMTAQRLLRLHRIRPI
jgi:uncharacterized phiE125 gp8 family phage protein